MLLTEALESSSKRRSKEHRRILRETLEGYLSYVNANLVLSRKLDVGFHDWRDYEPLYRRKFLSIGITETHHDKQIRKANQLFTVAFPEFSSWTATSILRALRDPRIVDLRQLVNQAATADTEFDGDYARRVLAEVLEAEHSVGRMNRRVSLITSPLGYIPVVGTPLQMGVAEIAGRVVERKAKQPFRWYYLISDFGRSHTP